MPSLPAGTRVESRLKAPGFLPGLRLALRIGMDCLKQSVTLSGPPTPRKSSRRLVASIA